MTMIQDRMTKEEFKDSRERLGYSLMGMANALHVHINTIVAWEQGVNPVSGPATVAVRLILERSRR